MHFILCNYKYGERHNHLCVRASQLQVQCISLHFVSYLDVDASFEEEHYIAFIMFRIQAAIGNLVVNCIHNMQNPHHCDYEP